MSFESCQVPPAPLLTWATRFRSSVRHPPRPLVTCHDQGCSALRASASGWWPGPAVGAASDCPRTRAISFAGLRSARPGEAFGASLRSVGPCAGRIRPKALSPRVPMPACQVRCGCSFRQARRGVIFQVWCRVLVDRAQQFEAALGACRGRTQAIGAVAARGKQHPRSAPASRGSALNAGSAALLVVVDFQHPLLLIAIEWLGVPAVHVHGGAIVDLFHQPRVFYRFVTVSGSWWVGTFSQTQARGGHLQQFDRR